MINISLFLRALLPCAVLCGSSLVADEVEIEELAPAGGASCYSASHKRELADCCCYDLLMANSTSAAALTVQPFPVGTPIPFPDYPLICNGGAICKLSDTMFSLREPGYYLINFVFYPPGAAPGLSISMQVKDVNGAIIFDGPRHFINNNTGAPLPIRYLYKVECSYPQTVQFVIYAQGDEPLDLVTIGLRASVSFIKLCDLPECGSCCLPVDGYR